MMYIFLAGRRILAPTLLQIGLLLGVSLCLSIAVAQRTVSIEPPVQLYTAQPGESLDATLRVTNPGETPIRVRLSLGDWRYRSNGELEYLPAGDLTESASDWITFSPSQVDLAPSESAVVRYTVQVPEDAQPGSHWSVLFFEGEDPDPEPGFRLAAFNVRVGHTIYVNTPPIIEEGLISGIFGERLQDDAYRLFIQYLNTGNAAQIVTGYIEIRNALGEPVTLSEFPDQVVLPNSDRLITFDAQGPIPAGNYTTLVVMNYGDETIDVAGDFAFTLEQALVEPAPTVEDLRNNGSP